MNSHTITLVKQTLEFIDLFENKNITQRKLMNNIEGISNAIGSKEIKKILEKFVLNLDESLYLYDENEGNLFLNNQIKELKYNLNKFINEL